LQLTSTSGAPESVKERAFGSMGPIGPLFSRLNKPVVPGVVAFLGWLGFVLARWQVWAHGQITYFVMAGSGPAHGFTHGVPANIIGDPGQAGYDGQFYYRLALNPFNWARTAYRITMDQSYRYTRIGYPFLAWLLSLGQHHLVPLALVVINLACVAAMGYLGGVFARDGGRHALWGVLLACYFGLAISVGRDTAEPLAEACMLAGLLACRRERYVWAAVAFTYGTLTRETILLAPAAVFVVRAWGVLRPALSRSWSLPDVLPGLRPRALDLAWALPVVCYGLLELVAKVVLKSVPLGADTSRNASAPFAAMVDSLRPLFGHIDWHVLGQADIALLEYACLFVVLAAGVAVIWVTKAPAAERVAFVFFTLQLGLLSTQIWGSSFGDGRSMIEPYLLAVILLLSAPARYVDWRRLAFIVLCYAPAFLVVIRRRILYM
jgi:hypothetical protein